MLRITPAQNFLQFSECSYKSRQPRGGPAPFASFEDLSDYLGEKQKPYRNTENTKKYISFTADDTSPEEIVPLPGNNGSP